MIILDTNTVSALMRGDEKVTRKLLQQSRVEVALAQPVVSEIQYGLSRLVESHRKQALAARWQLISGELGRIEWTDSVSSWFGQIKASLETQGQIIEDFDIALAAHAMAYGATLITVNTRHFDRVQGLHHEDWSVC
jgi:tRNA(fMet)-specific endonuclease VapC